VAKRLLQVPGAEVGFSHRRAEILIAGRSCISTGSIGLYSLTAHPDESTGRIDIDVSPWAHYVLSGDDSAREAAESLIRAEPADPRQMEAEVLKRLAKRAIRSGIKRSGPNRDFPDITSCGGRPRLRSFSKQY